MSKPERVPLRLPPAIIIPIIGLCLALVIGTVSFIVPLSVAAQAYAVILVLLGFRYWPPMIRWVSRMPVPHRLVFALLIGSMILGHFTLNSRSYFPFVAWCIFPTVREEDPVVCPEFIATTVSGKKVRLLAEQLFPSIIQINPLDDPNRFPPGKVDDLVHALTKMYNRLHAEDPVIEVNYVMMAVKLHPSENEVRTEPSTELIKCYDSSSGL